MVFREEIVMESISFLEYVSREMADLSGKTAYLPEVHLRQRTKSEDVQG